MQLNSLQLKSGVHLYYLQTKKFKTTTCSIYIHRPLHRREATLNALLSMVLRRACPAYPTSKALAAHMDDLYGATLETAVQKKGEQQIVSVHFSFANEKYLGHSAQVLEEILKTFDSLVLKQAPFRRIYKAGKGKFKSQILSEMNDKRHYANKRCIEIMCEGEAYGVHRLGYIEDLEAIDAAALYRHYRDVLLKSPMDIFICGEVDIFWVEKQFKEMFADLEVTQTLPRPEDVRKTVTAVRRVTEEQQIVQGKLCMGFRTNICAADPAYPALMLYNAVLGSGICSKLFCNVREKLSLCYYASSGVDYLKGIMTIQSGIEVQNFQRAYDEILVQMADMRRGAITEQELSGTRCLER